MQDVLGQGPYIYRSQITQDFVTEQMTELAKILPYNPKYEGLDFTGADLVVAVNVEVVHDGKYLALKRSKENGSHAGFWNNVAGHIIGQTKFDILRSAFKELGEEIGLYPPFNGSVRVGGIVPAVRRNQHLHIAALRVELDDPFIPKLNGEHTEYLWVTKEERALLHPLLPIVPRVERHFESLDSVPFSEPIALGLPVLA